MIKLCKCFTNFNFNSLRFDSIIRLLDISTPSIATSLTHNFNHSITQVKFPNQWKTSRITLSISLEPIPALTIFRK